MKTCPVIKYQIRDEAKAVKEYRALSKHLRKAGLKREARTVKSIAADEARHNKALKKVRRRLC